MRFNIGYDTSSRAISLISVTNKNIEDVYEIQVTYSSTFDEGCTVYCVLEDGTNIEVIDGHALIPVFSLYQVIQLKFVWDTYRFYSVNLLVLKESDIIKS